MPIFGKASFSIGWEAAIIATNEDMALIASDLNELKHLVTDILCFTKFAISILFLILIIL
jgi:hypothetical protein